MKPVTFPFAVPKLALLGAISLGLAAPAVSGDVRIVDQLYNARRIVTVHGHVGIQTTITFRSDERIDNIAVGDSTEWQVTPNKHGTLVFIKPMHANSHTNMTVITDKRTYLFDLVAGRGLSVAYILQFAYPPDPVPPPPPTLLPVEAELAKAGDPPAEKSLADLHFDWIMSGVRSLWPSRVFDDGQFVWLSWPKDVAPPAILRRDPSAGDGPLNYRIEGDYMVIDGIPAEITLKRGKQTATLMAPARPAPGGELNEGEQPTRRKSHEARRDGTGTAVAKPVISPDTATARASRNDAATTPPAAPSNSGTAP